MIMSNNLLISLMIGIIGFVGPLDFAFGSLMFSRPIVMGPLVGLVLGHFTQGIIIGASLELVFMGAISVGAYLPPDVIVGGVLGTAFAISMGKGVGAAIAIAMPIAMLSLAVGNLTSVIFPALAHVGDKYASEGKSSGITASMWGIGLIECTRRGVLCFSGYFIGSAGMNSLLNAIPQNIIDGLQVAANLMPAIGFAILLQMILSRNVIPYFFLGFLLSAYLKIPVLGVAIFGLIIIFITTKFNSTNSNSVANHSEEVLDDEDF